MGFDTKGFLKAKWIHRTEAVSVPDLKEFFKEGEPPVWIVRSLTGQEVGQAGEASQRNVQVKAMLEGLMSTISKEVIEATKDTIGLGEQTTADIAKRIEYLVMGSVDPVCSKDLAIRICQAKPITFYDLTNKIVELIGLGQTVGKQQPFGKMEKSEPASPSVTPKGDSSLK